MQIHPNIQIIDLAIYLEKEKTLVFGDLHLGYEASLNKKGVLIPKFNFQEMKERLNKIFQSLDIEKIVLNGDIKHDFAKIEEETWRDTLKLIDFLKEKASVILIKGNHDTFTPQIAKKRNLKLEDYIYFKDTCILHGDKILKKIKPAKILIMGHEHPAISFQNRPDKFKCFLKGKYKDKILISMPSFHKLTIGSDIKKEKLLSPFLTQDLNNFEIYIVEDKPYYFGRLKDL